MIYTVENTWKELHDAGVVTALVTFGAIEQHGHHLPLGTDWIIGDHMARALAEALDEDVYVLPCMPFGTSREHMACSGTITLRPMTLASVLEDLVDSLRHHGFQTILLLSAHGGNWILKPILRELNFRYPELAILWANGPLPDEGEPVPEDIHAGRGETSLLVHFRPDLARPITEWMDSPGVVGQEFNDYVGFDKTTRTGAWGRPTEATAEHGAESAERTAAHQAAYVKWARARVAELKGKAGIVPKISDAETEETP
jgi:creatinine amidohydrolase